MTDVPTHSDTDWPRSAPSVAEDPAVLEVENLHVQFDTPRGVVRAVDGVSISVRQHETVGIVGESGSGKSVFVRSLMNLLPGNARINDDARVLLDGRDIRSLPATTARRLWGPEIAMIFQDPMTSLNPVRRIGAQLTESMRYHLGLSKQQARCRALELLDRVRIPEPRKRLDEYPHELSGGMRQRVMIAVALACEPRLLIADEPTTALDVTVQKQILDLLMSLQEALGMSIILITHDVGVVAGYADRVAVMYAGQVVEQTTTLDLFDHMKHPYTEALLSSIPQVDDPSHTRLEAIVGRPPNMMDLPDGCRFAPRCRYAQSDCVERQPPLDGAVPWHVFRCFFPIGTEEGRDADQRNQAAGRTGAGLELGPAAVS